MYTTTAHVKRRGFTLLEMSIVVGIIGIILGSIVVLRSVILNAQLQSIISEYDAYTKAVKEFEDKYQALPGDMTNAQTMWGPLATGLCNGTTAATFIQTDTATCNGDGDGKVGTSDGTHFTNNGVEWFSFWKHLSNANLIDGKYAGLAATATNYFSVQVDFNIPTSKYDGGEWIAAYINQTTSHYLWADTYGNVFVFAGTTVGNGGTLGSPTNASLSPRDAQSLDAKIDDGMPGTGSVRAFITSPSCFSSNVSQTTATYASTTGEYFFCTLVFIPGF